MESHFGCLVFIIGNGLAPLKQMTKDKWIGLGFLIGGICFLWWTIKHPVKNDNLTGNIKGIIAGIGSIIIGIMLLLGKGHWN